MISVNVERRKFLAALSLLTLPLMFTAEKSAGAKSRPAPHRRSGSKTG